MRNPTHSRNRGTFSGRRIYTRRLDSDWEQAPARFVSVENPCAAGWTGCDSYTGGHLCGRDAEHPGLHICDCGGTHRHKKVDQR